MTNDRIFPEEWLEPHMKEYFLFDTAVECCIAYFDSPDCELYDICIEGTDPPTVMPTSADPTIAPSPKPPWETSESTCKSRWHISNEVGRTKTCTNDKNYPPTWAEQDKREHYLFQTAEKCCMALFPNEECRLLNVCPVGGMGYVPLYDGPVPTELPTSRPTEPWWYVDRTSGM